MYKTPLFFFPSAHHAQITRFFQFFDLCFSGKQAGTAIRGAGLMKKHTRPCPWTTCPQTHAESALDMPRRMIDSVSRENPSLFVAIDDTVLDSISTVLYTGTASRGSRLFGFHGKASFLGLSRRSNCCFGRFCHRLHDGKADGSRFMELFSIMGFPSGI
jgi:hypothetical protein